jgi:hypothetical protein
MDIARCNSAATQRVGPAVVSRQRHNYMHAQYRVIVRGDAMQQCCPVPRHQQLLQLHNNGNTAGLVACHAGRPWWMHARRVSMCIVV